MGGSGKWYNKQISFNPAQCFRDGPWPHIGLKFNASESNENQTAGTWDVVGKHRM